MHIPDGFLDARAAAVSGALAAAGLGAALWHTRRTLPPRRIPLMGLSAAFIFAAQMLNFPVLGGTSGHLVGGVLAAVLLGPSAAIVVLSTVLIVQCLVFADGGLLALGANIFNMAIIGAGGGWLVYRGVRQFFPGLRGQLLATAFACWCAVVVGAIACAGELAFSGTVNWKVVFPAMVGVHMLIGVGEAVITMLAILAIARTRPELIDGDIAGVSRPTRTLEVAGIGLLIALGLALFVSPFACPWPDGLDRTAEKLGFKAREAPALIASPLADYKIPGVGSPAAATALAGGIGTIGIFGLGLILARLLVPARSLESSPCPPPRS